MSPRTRTTFPAARRTVGVTMLVFSVVMVSAILWGIVRGLLERGTDEPPRAVDLVRLTEELDGIERDFRGQLAAAFAARPTARPDPEWTTIAAPLERRLEQVLRDVEDPQDEPSRALLEAATALGETFHATGLVWERHRADARELHRQAVQHLDRADAAISAIGSDEGTALPATGE